MAHIDKKFNLILALIAAFIVALFLIIKNRLDA